MASPSARMLRLLSLLQTHRFWTGGELAQRLAVSERTVRRDVDRLRELGYPVDATRGADGGYQLRSGAVMPPLLVDDEEAVAIAVGLRTAAGGAVGGGAVAGIEETSLRALAKVVQVMPPRLRQRVDALRAYTVAPALTAGPTIDAQVLTTLALACRDRERIRFAYTAHDGQASTRLAEPHRLVPLGRRWYLVAWDTERHDWRTFRVDRLRGPATTGATFRPRDLPAADAAAFVRERLGTLYRRHRVEVLVRAPVAAVTQEVAQWGTVTPVDGDSCRLSMDAESLDWPLLMLAAIAADFEVLSPPELREHLRRVGELFRRATGGPQARLPVGRTRVGLIWAQSVAGVIGRDGTLPWHLPEDLAHFRAVTTGHPVIMGRRTWESLPERFRPLPGRRNLVLSRRPGFAAPGAEVVGSLGGALAAVADGEVWVIGGAEVYAAAGPHATVAEVTEVDLDVAGDTYAPSLSGWTRESATDWRTSATGLRFRHLRYIRDPAG